MRSSAGLLLALVLTVGCSRATPAERAVADTEERLGDITSGHLVMSVLASSPGAAGGDGVGFEIKGPFAVGEHEGSLPVADLQYTRVTGAERRTTRFLSTGERAFVELDGEIVELQAHQVQALRVRDDVRGGGLEGLTLTAWVDDPRTGDGPAVDGVPTERIRGRVDPVAALNDLLALSAGFGVSEDSPPLLEDESAEEVRRAVETSNVELLTGTHDRLLRHLELVVELDVDAGHADLKTALGELHAPRLRLILDVTDVNERVQVEAPAG